MQQRSAEANSGVAFVRRLGSNIDPTFTPRSNVLVWNVGLRPFPASMPPVREPIPVPDIISQPEMKFLAAVYFEKVDPYYSFLDQDKLFSQINHRWLQSSLELPQLDEPCEALLSGVAALGSLFSQKNQTTTEHQLAESARLILEQCMRCYTPTTDLIAAWALRVSYLRLAGTPHMAWIASCTLMHLTEAAGFNAEPPHGTVSKDTGQPLDIEAQRRLFGIARHFNVWISFELGRSRVTLHNATTKLPAPRANGIRDVFSFLALSENLGPEKAQDAISLQQALDDILKIDNLRPPMILTQCNLMLCINRRLHALNSIISGALFDRFLVTAQQGLRASQEMAVSHCPWHQVANVPFQIFCTLLAIDNQASITMLPEAMNTLREIAVIYDTDVMREARQVASMLLKLYQQQKEKNAQALQSVIEMDTKSYAPHETSTPTPRPDAHAYNDFMFDLPSLQNLNDLDTLVMMNDPGRLFSPQV